jgi:hypothetical protein
MKDHKHPSSFRDPSGYVFVEKDIIYRRVNGSYLNTFSKLVESGLYDNLVDKGWLIPHEITEKEDDFFIIKPEQLSLITYPYEWSFSQLKDAALLTLRVHKSALHYGMLLKDATAFNVQFHKGNPVFIDTLSFDVYKHGTPWGAYGQFCRHFLAPLLLMKHVSPDLNKLHVSFLDGVPLDIASKMLPTKTHFSLFIKANIHMHAKAFNKYKGTFETNKKPTISLHTQNNIIQNMIDYISKLTLNSETEWGDYYTLSNYDDEGFRVKETTVKRWIKKYALKNIWDIGGNNGHFSRHLQSDCDTIICSDIDPMAVDVNYRTVKKNNEKNIFPLLIDYTNQSPGIGFANEERTPFHHRIQKLQVDCILALALIHHLAISANCTFEMLANSFSGISEWLLIEFVHPDDSWVNKLLQSKREARNLFDYYNKQEFETIFEQFYDVREILDIPTSKRTLYLMAKK